MRQKVEEEQDYAEQGQTQSEADPLESVVPSSSIVGGNPLSVLGIELIRFTPTEGDKVHDLNTIFYDKAKKRIVKRMEKKVNTGGNMGVMVTEKEVVHGTDKDSQLMARVGVATALGTEDNVDIIMTDLEQS